MIHHCCDTLLFHNEEAWMKKGDDTLFDVPMGSLHGAELCELIGLAILNELQSVFPPGNCGLYRDDGLAVARKGRRSNMIKTEGRIRAHLEKMGFKITIVSGLSATDFLDVYLDLGLDTFTPYKKPNSKVKYVCRSSNHPPHILEAIPLMVHGRLCRLSKDENAYDNNTSDQLNELKLSGYQVDNLRFEKPRPKVKTRRRKVVYFHPPFCSSVRTNVGRLFRNLVKKHFHPEHRLYKIINKNTVKLSYSCMPSMKTIISAHNKKILREEPKIPTNIEAFGCSCRDKSDCPLDGHCKVSNIIYKAVVTTQPEGGNAPEQHTYIGSTSLEFKKRWYGHTRSFSSEGETGQTALSRFVRKLQNSSKSYALKWSVLRQSRQACKSIKFCSLCNLERKEIAFAEKRNLLNRRNELVTRCPHNRNLFFWVFFLRFVITGCIFYHSRSELASHFHRGLAGIYPL